MKGTEGTEMDVRKEKERGTAGKGFNGRRYHLDQHTLSPMWSENGKKC